jgi:hypothetical protein
MTINQISVFLANRTGQLAQVCTALAENDISIVTLSLADTTDFGILRMIVSDHEKARQILTAAGHVVKVTPVFAVTVPDVPGGMAGVAQKLSAAGCDVEYSYAFAFHHGEKAVLVFRFADPDKAAKVLSDAGCITLDERQIEDASR